MSVAKFSINNLNNRKAFTKLSTLKDGSNLYRVLPPFGKLAEKVSRGENVRDGGIAKYWEIFWLQGTSDKKYRVPTILRTKWNGKGVPATVLQEDPVFTKYETLKKQLQTLEASGRAHENPDVLEYLKNTVRSLQLDKSYYLNVINPAGEISVLKLKVTAFQDLKARLQELDNLGVDAINPGNGNGIIFDFKRVVDEKGKVSYRVDIAKKTYKDPNTGRLVSENQYMEIGDDVLRRMESEAADLESYYRVKSPEDMKLLASLDSKTIDMVMSGSTEVQPDPVDDESDSAVSEGNVSTQTAPTVTAPTIPQSSLMATSQEDYESIVSQFMPKGKLQ